jgi:hypothetical protein
LRPKTSRLLFGQLVWRKIIFFQFFLLYEWTTYFTSFPWTLSTPNSDSVWVHGEFLLKTSVKFTFHVFSKELLHAAMWRKLPKGWRAGFSKNSFLPIKSWFFTFFHFFFLLMILHDVNFNVTAMIWMWSFWFFSRIFTRSIVLKFGVKTPVNKNNSTSLILTNMELKFEACNLNLIWKWGTKDPKKREDHLIFINFGVKKFTLKNTPQKKTLTFECYNLLDPMKWVVIFGGWCSTR